MGIIQIMRHIFCGNGTDYCFLAGSSFKEYDSGKDCIFGDVSAMDRSDDHECTFEESEHSAIGGYYENFGISKTDVGFKPLPSSRCSSYSF
jgi:hypothetical protein